MQYRYQCQTFKSLTDSVAQIILTPLDGSHVYQAGQYVDLVLADQERRPFSIANRPQANGELEFHIRHHEDNEFTTALFEQLRSQGEIDVDGPFGHCHLNPGDKRPLLMLAGGTGIVPMKAMLEARFESQQSFDSIHLYWGVNETSDLYLDALLESWQQQHPGFQYHPIVGPTLSHAVTEKLGSYQSYLIYLAGPYAMVRSLYSAAIEQGIDKASILSDML